MLLINFFRKASIILSVFKNGKYLMLFSFSVNSYILFFSLVIMQGIGNAQINYVVSNPLKTIETHLNSAQINRDYHITESLKQVFINRVEQAEQELIMQKHSYRLYSIGLILLTLALIIYIFYYYHNYKILQYEKEIELKEALFKIKSKYKLASDRLRIYKELHDNIERRLLTIIASIDNLKYAFDINDEILNSKLNSISDFAKHTTAILRTQREHL